MLTSIVRFSLRFRGIILALAIALLGYGCYTLQHAKYDVFPEFAPARVSIQTEARGLSPEQVELLVTHPIETAINGVSGIDSLRSNSIQGLSVVVVVFHPGSDIYRDRQLVAERLANIAGQLPQGVNPPAMTPLTSSTNVVLAVGLTSDRESLMELRTNADWTIRPRLLAVPGVANVTVFGGEVKQIQVQFRPENLIQYSLALGDVVTAAQKATAVLGAGFIENRNQRLILQSEGQSLTPAQIAATVVLHQKGGNVTLGQVADVREAPAPPFGAAAVGNKTGVQLVILAQYGTNTTDVTGRVEQALDDLRPALEHDGIQMKELFRPANFVTTAIDNIRSSLLVGAVLVVVVLFLFLFNFRAAAISCTAIPLSLLVAVTAMSWMGFTLNTITLGGLAIALGEVVDDAVIDVENILRRLRENATSDRPRSIFRVVLDASVEVRSAVVYATFAVALVFIPILTLSGVAGRLFAPLGIAYILSIMASLAVALTVTPALSMTFLGRHRSERREPPVIHWLKGRYLRIVAGVERVPRPVIAGVVFVTLLGLAAIPFFTSSFLPELKEGHFVIHMAAVPGTSLTESLRIGGEVQAALSKLPFVRAVGQRVGRAEQSEDTWGPHYSEIDVDLKPLSGEEAEGARAQISKALSQFAGVTFSVKTFLSERIEETLSGYSAAVVVNIFGSDLDELDEKAQQVARVLSAVPGATELQLQSPPGTPQVAVKLRPQQLTRWGFDPVTVLNAVKTGFEGERVGQIYQGNRVFEISVILPPEERNRITSIAHLPLKNSDGIYVRLGQLATIYQTSGRYVVLHDGARRVQTITLNVAGRDINSFVQDAQRQIAAKVTFPAGMYTQFTGTAAAQAQSQRDLLVHSLLAGLGIVLLLSIVLMNWRNLLLVLANIPFALVGGVLAVFATGGVLTLGSMVGFVTLFGITLRNSIMLISHYEHLVAVEGMEWSFETAMRGASERLAPILMTALVTALGLLPLAIGSGDPGREIEGPLAIVILGGLVTSTSLNLLVLPTLALRYGRFERPVPEP